MRAMDSAIALARDNKWELTVYWRQHRGILNCPFDRLFEPIPGLVVLEVKGFPVGFDNSFLSRSLRWYAGGLAVTRQECGTILSNGYDTQRWKGHKALYMVSYSRFHPNKDLYTDFKPTEELLRLVDLQTKAFTQDTIGLHIRRTDNAMSIENSPLERFEAAIQQEIARNDRMNCYVASDSEEIKEHLRMKFGERVICTMGQADRDSPAGVMQAAVELYALSRTQKIYGSYWSSFSHTAAHIGGIPELTVMQNEFKLAQ